jgi:hypothetical protein
MTKHNATWSEKMYYSDEDSVDTTDEDDKDHYWDYRDE